MVLNGHHESKFVGIINVLHNEAPSWIPDLREAHHILVNLIAENADLLKGRAYKNLKFHRIPLIRAPMNIGNWLVDQYEIGIRDVLTGVTAHMPTNLISSI